MNGHCKVKSTPTPMELPTKTKSEVETLSKAVARDMDCSSYPSYFEKHDDSNEGFTCRRSCTRTDMVCRREKIYVVNFPKKIVFHGSLSKDSDIHSLKNSYGQRYLLKFTVESTYGDLFVIVPVGKTKGVLQNSRSITSGLFTNLKIISEVIVSGQVAARFVDVVDVHVQ